jgi:putative ABC transport system permease protein
MEGFLRDLLYGVRVLAKNRAFTIIATVTLGFGIGANSAIFSAVHAVLMRPLPFENADRLVRVFSYNRAGKFGVSSWKDLEEWQGGAESFEKLATYSSGQNTVIGPEGPEQISTADASAGFFELMGVSPILGRTFLPDDLGHSGENRAVILGEGYWKRQFSADPNVVGQLIVVDDYNTRIIGVVPDRFKTVVGRAQIWFPSPRQEERRDSRHLPIIGRLRPGVSVTQANNEIGAITASQAQMYPETNQEIGASVESLRDSIVGGINLMLLILFGAVGMVLLIACANVANLLLARAAARSQEMAIRSALGASRQRLIRQFLTESFLIAILGGALALLLAWAAIKVLIIMNPGDIPRLDEVGLDQSVIGFTILVSLSSTLLFGLGPALRLSRTDVNGALKEVGRGIRGSRSTAGVRNLLVIAELAVSVVVLIGAGLLIRSFSQLLSTGTGFNQENLITATVSLSTSRYPSPESRAVFYDQLVTRLSSLPGTQSAAVCTTLPLGGSGFSDWRGFVREGRPNNAEERVFTQLRRISPGYFKTTEIPLLAGRDFTEADGRKAQPVVIISQSMARKVWPNEDPIGKKMVFGANGPSTEVVGLAGDIKRGGLDDPDDMATYIPLAQSLSGLFVIVARSTADPAKLAGPLKGMVESIDKNLPVANIETMDHFLSATLAKRRFILFIFSILGGLALLLAAIGTYGVVSYSVAERTQEIGVRMAMGATRKNILFLITRQAIRLTLIGVGLGLVVAFAFTRLLATYLFKVGPTDPLVFGAISVFLILVTLVASSLPALRATRVDPMLALRFE